MRTSLLILAMLLVGCGRTANAAIVPGAPQTTTIPNASTIIHTSSASEGVPAASRILLTGSTTITVDGGGNGLTQGSDATGGLTNPFLTLQAAVNFVCNNLDAGGNQIIVHYINLPAVEPVQNVPFTPSAHVLNDVVGSVSGGYVNRMLVIRGDLSTFPVMHCGAQMCFTSVNVHSGWVIEGFTLTSSLGAIECDAQSQCYFGQNIIAGNPQFAFISIYRSFLEVVSSYTVAGTGGGYHYYADDAGTIVSTGGTVTFLNPSAFYIFAYASAQSLINPNGTAYLGGAITGTKFDALTGAGIEGAANMPGTIAGNVSPPGWVQ